MISGRPSLLVTLIEPHTLAAAYLAACIGRLPRAEVVISGSIPSRRPAGKPAAIVVADADTLPFSLDPLLRGAIGRPEARVLGVGAPRPDMELCRWLSAGLRGFVCFERVETDLPAAITALLAGRLWFSRRVLEMRITLGGGGRNAGGTLTARELQVAALLRRGEANKEIATALGISERTVRFHLQNIFAKLAVSNRHAAERVLAEPGWAQAGGGAANRALAGAAGAGAV